MAEGRELGGLIEMLGGEDRDTKANPAGGLLQPGGIVSDVYFNTKRTRNRYLSLVAMLLLTNDGISDLDSSIHRWLNPVAEVIIEVQHRHHGR